MTRFVVATAIVVLFVLALAAAEGLVAVITGGHEWMVRDLSRFAYTRAPVDRPARDSKAAIEFGLGVGRAAPSDA